jgi:hypothetical protein
MTRFWQVPGWSAPDQSWPGMTIASVEVFEPAT